MQALPRVISVDDHVVDWLLSGALARSITQRPSTSVEDRVFGGFFDDRVGVDLPQRIGPQEERS